MQIIQAMVNPRLLTKANRLFTGSLQGRIIEILQNARRAGATKVVINNHDGLVSVRDNGRGVDDFGRLLDLGGSGWEVLDASEDPAGVGLFCLAPRRVSIRSLGHMAIIDGDGWTGAPVDVQADPKPRPGTILEFADEPWTINAVEQNAVFTGLEVVVDHRRCAQQPFVSKEAAHHPELGCRIEVRASGELDRWHSSCGRGGYRYPNTLVNFHGQVVGLDWHPVSEHHVHYLVDLTGEPTDIRLMLPARTRLVENEALENLKCAIELEAFRYLQRRGNHRLPYKQYLRAKGLGVELPEATPTFSVGLLDTGDAPEPVEFTKPDDWPLAKCYRLDPKRVDGKDTDEANVHLLGALGTFEEPFVPVKICSAYDGYSWANLPTIDKIEISVGKELQQDHLWSGTLTCVESLAITVHTSDGRMFSSPVCMAMGPPPTNAPAWSDECVLVTPTAREQLSAEEIWHHFGGWNDEGDTYDTQLCEFERELERYWTHLVGPDEHLRCGLLDATAGMDANWTSILIRRDGTVRVRYANQKTKTITAPS